MADDYKIFNIDLIDKLNLVELKKPDSPEAILNLILSLDESNDMPTARKLDLKLLSLIGLSKNSSELSPDLYEKYSSYCNLLKFVYLPLQTDSQIELIFRESMVYALRLGIKVSDQIRLYIISYTIPSYGNRFAQLVIKAISYNEELIGQKKIFSVSENKMVEPFLKNWLKSYNQSRERDEEKISLQQSEFLSLNDDAVLLPPAEKQILAECIRIYDFLRYPSEVGKNILSVDEGFENKKISVPSEPISIIQEKKEFDNDNSQEIIAAYQGDIKQQRAIEAQQEKLKKSVGTDPVKLQAEFYKSVQNQDSNATIAAVKLLALNGQLLDFIKNDQKLNKFLTATWAKLYNQQTADDFTKNPIQPRFVRLFLRYVLSDRLRMKESDACRIALQIGNILVSQGKLEYNRMAYFDISGKEFKWFED